MQTPDEPYLPIQLPTAEDLLRVQQLNTRTGAPPLIPPDAAVKTPEAHGSDLLAGVEVLDAPAVSLDTGEGHEYSLTGLTPRLRAMPVGSGIMIPRRDGWTPVVMRQLRNSIGVVCNRMAKATPDRFTTKTTSKGIQIWRLPKE